MGQAQSHSSGSAPLNEWLVEPAVLVAEAIPVVGAVVEAIPVVAVAATFVAEALEVVVGQPVAGLEPVRVGLEAKVVVGQVDDGRERRVLEAQLFFLLLGKR